MRTTQDIMLYHKCIYVYVLANILYRHRQAFFMGKYLIVQVFTHTYKQQIHILINPHIYTFTYVYTCIYIRIL